MIVVEFTSGLGNQLFQFAAGKALALHHNTSICADPLSFCRHFHKKKSRVSRRDFELKTLQFEMIYRDIPDSFFCKIRGYSRLRNILLNQKLARYRCDNIFNEVFYQLPSSCLLSGYFQDVRYFNNYREIIKLEILKKFSNLDRIVIPESDAVVHVRRGDYLLHSETYPDYFENYYKKIIYYIFKKLNVEKVHIFTDDVLWCRCNLLVNDKVIIHEPDKRLGGAHDLVSMSTAKVIAIANSTFSWWAAELASSESVQVLAPNVWSEWCENPKLSLYRDGWKIISLEDL